MLAIERQGAREIKDDASGVIDARCEGQATECPVGRRHRPPCGIRVRGRQIALCLQRDGIGLVDRSMHDPGRESRDGCSGGDTQVSADDGRPGAGHLRRAGQDCERFGRTKADGRRTCGGDSLYACQQADEREGGGR